MQLADLLEQLGLLVLALVLDLTFLTRGEKLNGSIQEMPLPLAGLHRVVLDRRRSAGSYRLAATDRLYGDSGLELRAYVRRLLMGGNPFLGGGTPPQMLTVWPVLNNQTPSKSKCKRSVGYIRCHSTIYSIDILWSCLAIVSRFLSN